MASAYAAVFLFTLSPGQQLNLLLLPARVDDDLKASTSAGASSILMTTGPNDDGALRGCTIALLYRVLLEKQWPRGPCVQGAASENC